MSIYFNSSSAQYALNFNELTFWSSHFGKLLLDCIPLNQKMKVLDVGCATGFPLLELADRLGKDSSLIGIDPWPAAVDYLKNKIEFRECSNAQVLLESIEKTPFEDDYFDLIVSNLGLNNFENKELAIRECMRVLSPGGRLAIASNYKGHMAEFYNIYRESLDELNLSHFIEKVNQDEDRRLTLAEIQLLFTTEGLKTTDVVERNFTMRYVSGSAYLESSFIESCFMPTWRSLVPESEQKKVFATIEDKLNILSKKEGELKISIPMVYMEFKK